MTDELNDCQGEHMYSAEIPINIELGSAGTYYGTSPQMKGLLVTGHTFREVMDRVPNAIAEMRAVAAMGAELAEAREIIGELISEDIIAVYPHGPLSRRARAFLNREAKSNG